MWISPKNVYKLLSDAASAQGEARALAEQNKVLQVTLDWMRARLNQVEHERAILLETYMGVKVPVPTLRQETVESGNRGLNPDALFADIGNKEAERLGIGWNLAGEVIYEDQTQ